MAEYIERDAVKDMLKRECSPRVMAYLVDELCKIPTADVRPVVLGRWGHRWICSNMSGYEYACSCSECGKPTYRMSLLEKMPNYCPNCGAKMEES